MGNGFNPTQFVALTQAVEGVPFILSTKQGGDHRSLSPARVAYLADVIDLPCVLERFAVVNRDIIL